MDRWTASDASGMSQRLYPRGATVRSRSSSDIRMTPSSQGPVRLFRYPQSFATNRVPGALALIYGRGRAAHPPSSLRPRLRLGFVWMRRVLFLLSLALIVVLVAAPVALGHDGGQGTYGEADDKVVTNAGFILIAFFPLFVLVMSLLQWRLEKRKERRKKTLPP